nr:endoglucanase 12 [Tanacetum cinerariifolium]
MDSGHSGCFLLIGVSVALAKLLPKHKSRPKTLDQDTQSRQPQLDEDQYSEVLHKDLLFFNPQKSGKLPKDNGIEWRGDSGLQDGRDVGGSQNGSKITDDQTCWQRPEDMDYNRPTQMITDRGFDLAGEM